MPKRADLRSILVVIPDPWSTSDRRESSFTPAREVWRVLREVWTRTRWVSTKVNGENENKIRNLTDAVERSGGSRVLLGRLSALEQEQKGSKTRLDSLKSDAKSMLNVVETKKLLAGFPAKFEKECEQARLNNGKLS